MVKEIVIDYNPRTAQMAIHDAVDNYRFVVVVAHRRFGKTVAAINEAIRAAIECQRERPRIGYIAPTYSQAKRVAWDYLTHYTRPLEAQANIAELRVDFWDRRIQLYGSDNPDALRGQYFDLVVLDEIADQNPKIWNEIIRPALADRKGKAIFIGTPKGQNHFKELRDRAEKEPDWCLLEFRASDTGVVDQVELDAAKREMGDDKYAQEFECSFHAAIEGAYYGKIMNDLESQNRFCQIARDDLLQTYCAWDLGMGDSTSIWVAQVLGKEIRLMDYIENHGQGLDWYVSELTNRGWHKAEMLLPHDVQVRELGTGRSRLEVLQEAGVSCTIVPRMPVADGIQAVRQMLPNCWFNTPPTKQGVDCLRNYRRDYDEKRNVYFEKPMHDWASHGSDAFRYLATGMTDLSNWSKPLKVNTGWVV